MRVRFRKVALLGALVGALGLVGIANRADAADPPVFTLPPFPADLGVLRLHMGGSSDYFRYDAKSGATYVPGTAEPLTASSCAVVSPLPTSMTITPTPNGGSSKGGVGLVVHSIGVTVKGEGNGTPCGQVNGVSQALDLKLAGQLAGLKMDYAELDVEGKFGVTVKAQLYLNGTLVRTELLPTGGPDSGPDSADGDNFRWRLPSTTSLVFFDEIKLSVDASTPTGAFSLEGGSDGTLPQPGGLGASLGTSDSLFHITNGDGVLQCGGSASENGTGGAPSITVTLQSGTGCQDVPFLLTVSNDNGLQAASFQKVGGTNNVYYPVTITWPVEASNYPIPPTQIKYGDGPLHPLVWCDGTPAAPIQPSADEPWCLVDHHTTLAGTDQMQVTEVLYGKGDPGYIR